MNSALREADINTTLNTLLDSAEPLCLAVVPAELRDGLHCAHGRSLAIRCGKCHREHIRLERARRQP